jgi:hypothetical protein
VTNWHQIPHRLVVLPCQYLLANQLCPSLHSRTMREPAFADVRKVTLLVRTSKNWVILLHPRKEFVMPLLQNTFHDLNHSPYINIQILRTYLDFYPIECFNCPSLCPPVSGVASSSSLSPPGPLVLYISGHTFLRRLVPTPSFLISDSSNRPLLFTVVAYDGQSIACQIAPPFLSS